MFLLNSLHHLSILGLLYVCAYPDAGFGYFSFKKSVLTAANIHHY